MKHTFPLLAALLLAPLAVLHAEELSPPLDAASWKARQGLVPAERLPAAFEVGSEVGLRFSLSGPMAKGKQMRWERPWMTGEHAPGQWLVLEYRAQWANSILLALLANDAAGKPSATTLVSAQDLVRDGLWHRLVVQRPYPAKPTALRVLLDSNDSRSWFELRRLEWVASPELAGPALAEDKQPSQHPDLQPLPLTFNDRYDLLRKRPYMRVENDTAVLDGGAWFTRDEVSLEGVPFRVESKPGANNLITSPEPYSKLPPWYEREKKKVLFRDILTEWQHKAGHKPDILHLWDWTYYPATIQRWGEYGGRDYDNVGGQPAFNEAIADVQNNLGIAMSLYRFLFPKLMHLDLPLGITNNSWHPLKFTFFNGEAIYDSYWNIDESRGHAFIARAYELKKRFKDCFTSDAPEMLVATERDSVYANRFPGKARTVWTLYNARPNTVRGEVLAVPHHEGASYRDEWTDTEIHPEIRDGKAILSLELGPQSIGCISQTLPR